VKRWIIWLSAAAAFLIVLAVSAVWIAQSDWFRERVRVRLISEAETATGGKVEIGSFGFDWRTLTARIDRLVIHGSEPSGAAPLLAVDSASVTLRVVSLFRRDFSIDRLVLEHPNAHLIVQPDGRTNLPPPRLRSDKGISSEILDLKIGAFDLREGMFLAESSGEPPRITPWSASGRGLAARISYEPAAARYSGAVSMAPLRVMTVDLEISAQAVMERNRLLISQALLKTAQSEATISNAAITDFAHPVYTLNYSAHISIPEIAALVKYSGKPSGFAELSGDGRFVTTADYRFAGSARVSGLQIDRLRGVDAAAALAVTPEKVEFNEVRIGLLGGRISGSGEIRDLKTYVAQGRADHFDLRQVAALVTDRSLSYDGYISGPFEVEGRIGSKRPDGSAQLDVSPAGSGPGARGHVVVRYAAAKNEIELGASWVELPHSRVDVSGNPGGKLTIRAVSHDVSDFAPAIDSILASVKPAQKRPDLRFKSLAFDGTAESLFGNPKATGHLTAEDLSYEGNAIQSFAGDITASSSGFSAANASIAYEDFRARGSGSIQLTDWKPEPASAISGNFEVQNADVGKLLVLAGHKEIPITGTLGGKAQISGTLGDPVAKGDVEIARGTAYEQPFDSFSGSVQSPLKSTQTFTGLLVSGAKRINVSARYEHAAKQFPAGALSFNATSNTMALAQIAMVHAREPDIHGFGKVHADGDIRLTLNAKNEMQFSLMSLNADASANGVEVAGRSLGDARFVAQTENSVMRARFDSNAANAAIRGEGSVRLEGEYPFEAKITFSKAGLGNLAALVLSPDDAGNLSFDGEAEGSVAVSGPALQPERIAATVDVTHLDIHPAPGTDIARALSDFAITNSGPVRASVANSQLRIDSARFTAPQTDLRVEGTVGLTQQMPFNLRAEGTVNLAIARSFNKDFSSSGALALNATLRGDRNAPDLSGRATIQNAELHYADFTNGLANASGEIVFSGSRATIQSFHAESGGGKIEATGFVSLTAGTLNFRVEAKAQQVRVRYPEGVSSISDAAITAAGSSQRSEIDGVITIHRVSINPRSDAANILASAAQPIKTPVVRTGILSNMNLNIRVETAPDVAVQTSVAQSLEANANLTLRGTLTNPALLGRINVTQGELNFFGNKYSISQGTISFFNPARIDPILNVDFQTKARGVDVIITVSGPMDKLNVTYRSDPPLQFGDIVSLLATGRAPSDPTLAVRDTGRTQSYQQLGATALLGQAIASPVSGRLQRFFGVSRLKIDPQLTGITGSPEARLTVEQQITPEILFTYITDVSSTSTQLIRVEWSLNPRWSAILVREENGYVGLNFAYRKRFK
jgi:translocation and assembly module TamB